MIYIKAKYICNDLIKNLYKDVYWKSSDICVATINHECVKYVDHIDINAKLNETFDILDDFNELDATIYLKCDYLPNGLFKYCVSLYELDISYLNVNIIPEYFCNQCRFLKRIKFPYTINEIKSFALTACDFEKLDFSRSKTVTFCKYAATNCRHLTYLLIPKKVKLESFCFAEAYTLKQINYVPAKIYIDKILKSDKGFYLAGVLKEYNKYSYKYPIKYDKNCKINKFIINQNHELAFKSIDRHFNLANDDDLLIFGGGLYDIKLDCILSLHNISEGFGKPDFSKLDFDKIPSNIYFIYYNNEIIYKK